MTDPAALQKLLTWLSPAFPVGAFAWSAGLETAIADRRVSDSRSLQNWIEGSLAHGGIRTDAILLTHAWRIASDLEGGRPPTLATLRAFGPSSATLPARGRVYAGDRGTMAPRAPEVTSPLAGEVAELGAKRHSEARRGGAVSAELVTLADLALALTPAAERHKETLLTGEAFVRAAEAWPSPIYAHLPDRCPYPIAVGAIAAAHGIGLSETLLGYLTAAVHAQVSVAVRLVPLGQADGLRAMAALEPRIAALSDAAATATLEDIGGIAYAADIAQMRHETLEPRIFRS